MSVSEMETRDSGGSLAEKCQATFEGSKVLVNASLIVDYQRAIDTLRHVEIGLSRTRALEKEARNEAARLGNEFSAAKTTIAHLEGESAGYRDSAKDLQKKNGELADTIGKHLNEIARLKRVCDEKDALIAELREGRGGSAE